MGRTRHQAIGEVGGAEVIAISEPSIGDSFKSIPNLTHDEIIRHPDINAIIICTPNYLNRNLPFNHCLQEKMFLEKPPCFTAKEMEEVIQAEKKW